MLGLLVNEKPDCCLVSTGTQIWSLGDSEPASFLEMMGRLPLLEAVFWPAF